MSVDSGDALQRLLDHDFGDHDSAPSMQPHHISIPVAPGSGTGLAPGSTSSGTATHASSRGSKQKGQKAQKKSRKMAWLLIHNTGEVQTIHMDKRQLIQVMGLEIPMRDLRLMDPALAAWDSFANILVRDNALVVSADHVRLIITCDKVIFPLDFEKTEASQRFMKSVEAIIRERPDCIGPHSAAAQRQEQQQHDTPLPTPQDAATTPGLVPPALQQQHRQQQQRNGSAGGQQQQPQQQQPGFIPPSLLLPHELQHANSQRLYRNNTAYGRDPELLPFELNMLEAALGEITRHYTQQTATLESLAHPALDALMRKCNSTNLERVRKIKTQHQRLLGRLQGLREILERYMEDDQDMYRMCLSKWRDIELENADAGSDNTLLIGRRDTLGYGGGTLPRRATVANLARSPTGMMDRFQGVSFRRDRTGDDTSSSSSSSSSSRSTNEHDLLEVENLLESYLMMVDGTLAKLAGIGEYIDDTEDYINIELDYNRNRLLRIEILLTVATFSLALYNLVAGVLGENLVLPAAWTENIWGFIIINCTMVTICATVFFITWKIMVKKKLI